MVKNIAAVIADVGDVSEEALTLNRNEVNKQTYKQTNNNLHISGLSSFLSFLGNNFKREKPKIYDF